MIFNSLGSNYNLGFVFRAVFSLGSKSNQEDLKNYLEASYKGKAVLLYKGREAILLALKILNLPSGSEVLVNGYTCFAVYQAIAQAGCVPVYADVSESGMDFSAPELERKLESHPDIRVVMVQNTLGFPCDMGRISEICRQRNIILIEDLAHSVGTVYANGQKAGSVGDFVVLSFSQDKIIDAVSGGALIIRKPEYQEMSLPAFRKISLKHRLIDRFYPDFTYKIRLTYPFGLGKLQHKVLKSLKLLSQPMGASPNIILHALPAWHAGLVLNCFKNLKNNLHHRRQLAEIYAKNISGIHLLSDSLRFRPSATNLRFPIIVKHRRKLIEYLKKQGVHISDIWYDAPVAPLKFLGQSNYAGECVRAEKLSEEMLNLPTHISVSEAQAKQIAEYINLWFKLQSKI